MEELKPCPFCGRKPEIRHNADGFSYVLCANDGCYARTDGCLNDNEAAKVWNRRAEPENKALTLEELPCFKPIYVVPIGSSVGEWSAHWCIYQIDNATAKSDTHKGRMWFLYDTDYGKTWLAYAREPEGSEKP